jgi:nitroreductase
MKRRDFVRLAGGGVVFAALPNLTGCSSEIPTEAVAAWRGPATDVNVREWILSYAILAPHSHNLQSWMIDLRQPDSIILYCDLGRLLPETDPYFRQIMMSHGTFLELLDIAAREKGLLAEIDLFPEGAFDATKIDQRPVARVRLAADKNVKRDPLFAEITRRRTNREAYETRTIPPEAIRGITDSVAGYPIRIGFVGNNKPDLLTKHRMIAAEAWRIELVTPRTILESYKVLRVGPEEIAKHRDGISVNKPFLRLLASLGLFDRSKAPAPEDSATTSQIKEFNSKLDTTPAFFWMITEGNDRKTQVNAGRAYVRAQLAATQRGLSMQPISQALQEYPEVAGPYAAIHQLLDAPPPGYTVQMWTRLGYAPAIGPAPRRGLKEHIVRS